MDLDKLVKWWAECQEQQRAAQLQQQQQELLQILGAQQQQLIWEIGAQQQNQQWQCVQQLTTLLPSPSGPTTRELSDATLPHKVGAKDDPEVFLIMFEHVALAVGWTLAQWTTLPAPYLMRTSQAAYHVLPNEEARDYRA